MTNDIPTVAQIETTSLSDVPAAIAMARRALDAGVASPLLLNLRAYWLETQGRLDEALADLEQARTMAPKDALIHNAIGECLTKLLRIPEAINAFDEAIRLAPGMALARFNKGYAYERLGLLDLAQRCYERAAEQDAGQSRPLARLATLAARRSNWQDARSLADHALALDPRDSNALFAHATADIAEGKLDEAEQRLRIVLDDAAMDAEEHATASSMLGDVFDEHGRTTDALAAYNTANKGLRDFFTPQFGAGKTETISALTTRLGAEFRRVPADAWKRPATEAADAPAQLVFLLGFPRSGNTLLGQVLAAHPMVETLEEKVPLVDSIRDFMDAPDGMAKLASADEAELEVYRQHYWRHVRGFGLHLRDKVLVDKMPFNILRLPLIAKLFPDAKILLATRDPRDVVFSCYRRLFAMHPLTYEFLTLEGTAAAYDAVMRLADTYRAGLALNLLDVRNEDLIADFERRTREICDFVGLPWNKDMHNFAERAKVEAIATPSAPQIARGLNSDGVGQWGRYEAFMAPVLPVLQPWVDRMNEIGQ